MLLAMRRLYLQNMGALERRREELAALVMPVRFPARRPFTLTRSLTLTLTPTATVTLLMTRNMIEIVTAPLTSDAVASGDAAKRWSMAIVGRMPVLGCTRVVRHCMRHESIPACCLGASRPVLV